MLKQLELTNEMIERNDEIDNAVFDCLCKLAETPLDWDMQMIAEATDAIKDALKDFGIKVRHPAVVTDNEGKQSYADFDF